MKPRIKRNLLDDATRRRATELFPQAIRAVAKAREEANQEQEKQLWEATEVFATVAFGQDSRELLDIRMNRMNALAELGDIQGALKQLVIVRQEVSRKPNLNKYLSQVEFAAKENRIFGDIYLLWAHVQLLAKQGEQLWQDSRSKVPDGEIYPLLLEINREAATDPAPSRKLRLQQLLETALATLVTAPVERFAMEELRRDHANRDAIFTRYADALSEHTRALGDAGIDRELLVSLRRPYLLSLWTMHEFDRLDTELKQLQDKSLLPLTATTVHTLNGHLALQRMELDRALASFRQVSAIANSPDHWADEFTRREIVITNQNNMALAHTKRGDRVRAAAMYRQALESARAYGYHRPNRDRRVNNLYADLLTNVANTIRNHGPTQRASAFANTNELLQLLEQDQDPAQFAIRSRRCNALHSLAIFHYEQGELSTAREIFVKAYELSQELYPASTVQRGDADCNAAWLAFESGELETAEAAIRRSVDHYVNADGEFGFRSGEAMAYLGRFLYERGKLDEARTALRRAIESRRVFMERMLDQVQTDRELLALIQELRTHNEVANWPGVLDTFLTLAEPLSIPAEEQYRAVLDWKGVTARKQKHLSQSEQTDDPEVARLFEKRAELLEQLRSTARSNLQAYLDGVEEQHNAVGLERDLSTIELQLAQLSPAFAKEVTRRGLRPADVGSALVQDTCLVDIIEVITFRPLSEFVAKGRGRQYVAFVVQPDGKVSRIDEAEHSGAEAIDADITWFGERILDGARAADLSRGLDALNAFTERIRDAAKSPRMMIVCPDGKFHQLPFAALYDESDDRYWIEHHAIAYCSSARALMTARDQTPRAGLMLLAGNMDYGKHTEESSKVEWFSLPETRFEMAAIQAIASKLKPECTVATLSGGEADEKRVTEKLAEARYVHLATHGYFANTSSDRDGFAVFDISDLLDSAMVLAGANEPQTTEADQYLTAAELGELDLRGIELFVLSACETGLGHVSSGQGLVGLLGTLERGGVKTTLSSLWQVPESASAQLMEQFYRQAFANPQTLAAADCLRQAQLRLLGPDRQTAPYDWAAWVVTGDPF